MKKTVVWTIILLLSLSGLGFAQRGVTTQGRVLRVPPVVSLSVAQTEFYPGEQIDFALRVTQGPLLLPGSYYTVERQVGPNNWAEFYRSAQNPFGQAFLAPNTEQGFSWDQSNTMGSLAANPGAWRLRFFVQGAAGEPATVYFNITAGAGTGGGPLDLKLMHRKLVLGQKVVFRLQNVGNQAVNLRGHHYVIQYRSGNRWVDFLKSGLDALDISSLAPGQIYKWEWSQRDRAGHLGPRGDWKLVFFAPQVPNSPFQEKFDIK